MNLLNMKRLLWSVFLGMLPSSLHRITFHVSRFTSWLVFLGMLPASLALATTNYINTGGVTVISPPGVAPQIDASNFVNQALFSIVNTYYNGAQPSLPYESWNTRNWTNASRMVGDSGFRFDYYDRDGGTNGWSANFQNSGNANPTNANIYGETYLLVSATNLNNKGTLAVGGAGLMTLAGQKLDFARGTFGAVGTETNELAGVRDIYWGVDNGNPLTATFTPTFVSSSYLLVTTIETYPGFPPMYGYMWQNLQLASGFKTYIRTNALGSGIQAIDVLFLRQTNPAITTEVRFSPFGSPGSDKIVQWQALLTNRATASVVTNQLYLEDTFASSWGVPPFVVQTPKSSYFYTRYSAATYHPYNYAITHAPPYGYGTDLVMNNVALDPQVFAGTNYPTYATNAGYSAALTASAFIPDPTISFSTYTNVPGRIEMTAAGPNSYLDLNRAKISGESYLLLNATNHFVGCTNAVIVSPVSDFYLGNTNASMAISNLTTPFIPRMAGEVEVWSGRWTNTSPAGIATYYNVTMIDSRLEAQSPSQIQNLSLRSDNLLIGDALNVFGSLTLDTLRLTISTNAANAPTPYGEINLTSGDIVWSANLPRLQCLTNFGKISNLDSIYFGFNSNDPPWFSGTFDAPYLSFVNHGFISSQGNSTWANYYEASGTNNAGDGPLSVQAGSATITNGIFLATDADISLTCGSLLISNQVLVAGRSITLAATNKLDDGSLLAGADAVNHRNIWQVGFGINLTRRPANASLLATTVNSFAYPGSLVSNLWAGLDLGAVAVGYSNNAALGRLILDGGESSAFDFEGPSTNNALYVDYLECRNYATNFDSSGNLANLQFASGMKIYYAQLIINGVSLAEKLNGKNGGGLNWVPSYAGTFSSTNVVYPDGTTNRLNLALVTSCDLDSNNNGIPNCLDPAPVLIPSQVSLSAVLLGGTNIVLSWNGVPFKRNYLELKRANTATNWTPLTNIFVPGPECPRLQVTDRITNTVPQRLYRVRLDAGG